MDSFHNGHKHSFGPKQSKSSSLHVGGAKAIFPNISMPHLA